MLGFHLRRTAAAVTGALGEALVPLGLNPGEATLLRLIGANPGCSQSDIARALRAQPANLVPLINKLALSGLLDKGAGKGRAIPLTLTAEGLALHGQVCAAFDAHEARIGRSIPIEQRRDVIALLRQICLDACCGPD
nr:MarR family transcriptional regulator [Sphingobium scionense]